MTDLGYIRTESYKDPEGGKTQRRPANVNEVGYGWQAPSGVWEGWFPTMEDAINDAPKGVGAFIVEKRLSQRQCCVVG